MKTVHQALMGITLVGALAVSLGFVLPHGHGALHAEAQHGSAQGQHGHAMSIQDQFEAFATHLELTEEQKEAVAAPFQEGMMALENLHRLHSMIAAELTEEQQHQFAEMVHGMVGASFTGQGH